MNEEITDLLLFVGLGLYLFTSLIFFFLFIKTLKVKDGVGLKFLRLLTFGVFVGSTTVTVVRFCSLYGHMNAAVGRSIAIINPLILLTVGLYLNYLFCQKYKK